MRWRHCPRSNPGLLIGLYQEPNRPIPTPSTEGRVHPPRLARLQSVRDAPRNARDACTREGHIVSKARPPFYEAEMHGHRRSNLVVICSPTPSIRLDGVPLREERRCPSRRQRSSWLWKVPFCAVAQGFEPAHSPHLESRFSSPFSSMSVEHRRHTAPQIPWPVSHRRAGMSWTH